MSGAGTEVSPLGVTCAVGQKSGFLREHILCMRKVECHVQVLSPRKVDLYIVVKLRREVGVTHLRRVRIYIGNKRVKHPVVRSLDTSGVRGADANRLCYLPQWAAGIADIGCRERVEVRLARHRVGTEPVAVAISIFATQTDLHRPVFAKLLAGTDICCGHVLVVAEVRRFLTQERTVQQGVSGHIVVSG